MGGGRGGESGARGVDIGAVAGMVGVRSSNTSSVAVNTVFFPRYACRRGCRRYRSSLKIVDEAVGGGHRGDLVYYACSVDVGAVAGTVDAGGCK